MKSSIAIPEFCTSPTRVWPFQIIFPDIVLVYSLFDSSKFLIDDFDKVGISINPSIQKSVRKRQAEFLAGRVCALAATQMLGRADPAPQIGAHREPVWHDAVIGSITHTDNLAAAAVSYAKKYRGLGIDYEAEISESTRNNIIHEILTSPERAYYDTLDEQDRAQFFTLAFSLKESFFKAAFKSVGFYFDFQTVCVADLNSERGIAKLNVVTTLSSSFQAGSSYDGFFFHTATGVGTLVTI